MEETSKKHSEKKQETKKGDKKPIIPCKFGVKCCSYWCLFKHYDETGKELTKKDFMLCPFFLKGKCKRGNACEYKHASVPKKTTAPKTVKPETAKQETPIPHKETEENKKAEKVLTPAKIQPEAEKILTPAKIQPEAEKILTPAKIQPDNKVEETHTNCQNNLDNSKAIKPQKQTPASNENIHYETILPIPMIEESSLNILSKTVESNESTNKITVTPQNVMDSSVIIPPTIIKAEDSVSNILPIRNEDSVMNIAPAKREEPVVNIEPAKIENLVNIELKKEEPMIIESVKQECAAKLEPSKDADNLMVNNLTKTEDTIMKVEVNINAAKPIIDNTGDVVMKDVLDESNKNNDMPLPKEKEGNLSILESTNKSNSDVTVRQDNSIPILAQASIGVSPNILPDAVAMNVEQAPLKKEEAPSQMIQDSVIPIEQNIQKEKQVDASKAPQVNDTIIVNASQAPQGVNESESMNISRSICLDIINAISIPFSAPTSINNAVKEELQPNKCAQISALPTSLSDAKPESNKDDTNIAKDSIAIVNNNTETNVGVKRLADASEEDEAVKKKKNDSSKGREGEKSVEVKPAEVKGKISLTAFLNQFEKDLIEAERQCGDIAGEVVSTDINTENFEEMYEFYAKYFDEKLKKANELISINKV